MNRDIHASGLQVAGSDATTTNPLPATTPTVTTRTHNQLQPQPLPTGAVAAAPLQSHRGDPHLAGNEACLCSSCHLRDKIFPRSQDGRIVLPDPSFTHSTRLPSSTPTLSAAPLGTPGLLTWRSHRIESTASNTDPKSNEGRRGGGSRSLHVQSDKGEGSSTGGGRLSGNMGESSMTLPHSSSSEIISTGISNRPVKRRSASDKHRCSNESQRTPGRGKPRGRSSSGFSRRARLSKKHDQQPERPDSWPRNLDSEEFAGQPNQVAVGFVIGRGDYNIDTQQSTLVFQHSDESHRKRPQLFLDTHGTAQPVNLSQTFQARELSRQAAKLETPRSATPSTAPQTHTSAYDYEHRSPLHQGKSRFGMTMSISSYPETPGRVETSHHHPHHHQSSASRRESATGMAVAAQDKPKIIRFSSRSENPQPDSNPAPTMPMSDEKRADSSPTIDPPQFSPSSSTHQLRSHFDDSSSSSFQTQFQFQEPVVPETHATGPIHTGEPSNVQVKWDSERKRRQGYFAQEGGVEKSPFRHYNKANCDFED